ncbi:MAG TPA: lactate utilization protein [Afifellaceae bacterium]|nr:lactate utilization protein [Afifellaceae bacterium]
MSGRKAVLSKIRRALAASGSETDRKTAVDDRLANPAAGLIPARGQLDGTARVDLFCKMAEAVEAGVTRVASAEDVPEAIAGYLRQNNLPAEIRLGADDRLAGLPWEKTLNLTRKSGPSDGRDLVGVSHALGGVAETGTLVLHSGAGNPTTLNFLPDTHIVVVDAVDIAGDYETVWQRIRGAFGKGVMPRTVNWITGPSRSADIEQTILLGAHGPRALQIIVVGGET